jgi:hypothetical protein
MGAVGAARTPASIENSNSTAAKIFNGDVISLKMSLLLASKTPEWFARFTLTNITVFIASTGMVRSGSFKYYAIYKTYSITK